MSRIQHRHDKPRHLTRYAFRLLMMMALLGVILVQAAERLPSRPLIFPDAEGFGVNSPAGRDGRVYRVSNLKAAGKGSLRECLDGNEPRICMFDVGGVIRLKQELAIRNPFITIAGQTAPSPGVSIYGAGIRVVTHDVLIQHLRIRVGDDSSGPPPGNRDGIGIEGDDTYNVVIDHCSIAWAIDESVAIWGESLRNITISNSIIAEALAKSLHPKGEHSMGLLVGPKIRKVAIVKNALLHNGARNPLIRGGSMTMVVNNLIHNTPWTAISISDSHAEAATYSAVVGNVVTKGKDSNNINKVALLSNLHNGSRVYAEDNQCATKTSLAFSCVAVVPENSGDQFLTDTPFILDGSVNVLPSSRVKEHVIANVGARPNDRDEIDKRLMDDIANGSGSIVDKPTGPMAESGRVYRWTESDSRYSLWQSGQSLDGQSREMWLHELAQALIN